MIARTVCPSARRRAHATHGLTLVELLVTLTIISILASTVLFAMAAAVESAKKAKTRSIISRLNTLLMERWDSYLTRRVPVSTAGLALDKAAILRLDAIRELMLLEMPDRWADVTTDPVFVPRTALSLAYLRHYQQLNGQNSAWPTAEFQNAECLYMIITMGTGEGEALEQFGESEIGDADGDGAREFLDAWGQPIRFLRWPAGFVSELQPLVPGATDPNDIVNSRNPAADHDPFDPMKVQPEAYRLVPLIYSAGPDGETDIVGGSATGYSYARPIDPYEANADGKRIGTQGDVNDGGGNGIEEWHDNIHNHLIGTR